MNIFITLYLCFLFINTRINGFNGDVVCFHEVFEWLSFISFIVRSGNFRTEIVDIVNCDVDNSVVLIIGARQTDFLAR